MAKETYIYLACLIQIMLIKQTIGLGQDVLKKHKTINAFMGVSLGRPFYSKENVEKYLLWANEYCDKFVFILSDDPERWNYEVFKRMGQEDALAFARRVGDEYKRCFQRMINKHDLGTAEVKTWRDLFDDNSRYRKILKTFQNHFKEDYEFKEDCIQAVWQNLGQKIEKDVKDNKNEVVKYKLVNYLLEELTATVFFIQNSFPVEINPRKLAKINENIYIHKYDNLSDDLGFSQDWGYVQLNIE